jgi:hypothetical protein
MPRLVLPLFAVPPRPLPPPLLSPLPPPSPRLPPPLLLLARCFGT